MRQNHGRFGDRRTTCLGACAAALAALLLGAPAASAFVVGAGSAPGLAVDAAGTAYIAWVGPEAINSTLGFCRLPRGAVACDAGAAQTIATPANSTSLTRPFVSVSGARVTVTQYRYATSGVFTNGNYLYTSADGGASFGAGLLTGTSPIPFNDAVAGPGDTVSGIANNSSFFQNLPLDGTVGVPSAHAELSATHPYNGAVALVDAATPLVVYTDGSGNAQTRRYTGAGSLNDVANWTAPLDIGVASYPRLAGGPIGLFMLSASFAQNGLFVRHWNGSAFDAPVALGAGDENRNHLFEDAAGRLQAVYQRDNADPLRLMHAVSDDGVTWRSGTVVTQDIATSGGISDPRVATAPDHIGVTVWHAGLGAGDVRVAAVGPDAPIDAVAPPVPSPIAAKPTPTPLKPTPKFGTTTSSATRSARSVRVKVKGRLTLPVGVSRLRGCNGKVRVTVKRSTKVIAARSVTVSTTCGFAYSAAIARAKVKNAKKLTLRLRFGGNAALGAKTRTSTVKVVRARS
jgi:hypothetical protein